MDQALIEKYERLISRKLSSDDILRLQRVKDTLGIRDDDAIWDILIAIDFQKNFYESLPKKIEDAADKMLENIRQAAQSEATIAQAALVNGVVNQAQKLGEKLSTIRLFMIVSITIFCLLLVAAASMWVGFMVGSGQAHPPALLLKMPVGLLMVGIGLGGGGFCLFQAAQAFSDGSAIWKKQVIIGIFLVLLGAFLLSLTI